MPPIACVMSFVKLTSLSACCFSVSFFASCRRFFERRDHAAQVLALQAGVFLNHQRRGLGVRPHGNILRAVERVAEGMVEMVVRINRRAHRRLAHHAQCLVFEGRGRRGHVSFDEQRRGFADDEPAVGE
ncbi:MAG TPA: hypothetical protein VGQ11_03930 [Candidatus Acidoferrales bacterium]|nr:hypothetical protein [Candidatus Acidoferrales bacterium]